MKSGMRRAYVAGLVVTVAAGVSGFVPATGSDAASTSSGLVTTAFKFNPGLKLLDNNGANTGAAEPSLDVDTAGNVYVTGPAGVPTGGCPFWTVHPGTFNAKGQPYDYRGLFDIDHGGIGGGDCDVAHGARSTLPTGNNADSISASSLSLANLTTDSSQDRGATFRTPANNAGCNPNCYGVDRQWQGADRKLNVFYMIVHDVATANIQTSVSYDGGYSYVGNTPAITAGTPILTAQGDNHFSPPVVDPKTHKIYIAYVAPADPAENAAYQADNSHPNEHVVYVAVGDPCAVSCPVGGPIGPISWTDYPVYTAPTGQDLAHIFPTIAIDAGNASTGANKNVYIGWIGDTSSSSTNRFQMTHFNVSTVPSTTDPSNPLGASVPIFIDDGTNHSNMFPWLVAGKQGIVDAAWYSGKLEGSGTTCPTGATGSPDNSNGVNNNCFNIWHTQFAQVTSAAGASPVVTRSYASGINHRGSICDQGLNCSLFGGDRSLLDYFDMDLDPAGGANIAYVQDQSQITYTRQCSGKSAKTGLSLNRSCGPLAPPPPSLPASVCGTGATHTATVAPDPTGDASNPTGGGTNGSTDVTHVDLASPATAQVDVTLAIQNLQDPAVPPPGTADIYYYVTWKAPNGKQYAVEHDEPEPPGAKTYTFGEYDPSNNQLVSGTTTPVTGSYNAGSPASIVWHVPTALFGSPSIPASTIARAAVQKPYAVITVGLGALGTGLVFTQPSDRAPNSGYGSTWSVC